MTGSNLYKIIFRGGIALTCAYCVHNGCVVFYMHIWFTYLRFTLNLLYRKFQFILKQKPKPSFVKVNAALFLMRKNILKSVYQPFLKIFSTFYTFYITMTLVTVIILVIITRIFSPFYLLCLRSAQLCLCARTCMKPQSRWTPLCCCHNYITVCMCNWLLRAADWSVCLGLISFIWGQRMEVFYYTVTFRPGKRSQRQGTQRDAVQSVAHSYFILLRSGQHIIPVRPISRMESSSPCSVSGSEGKADSLHFEGWSREARILPEIDHCHVKA